MAKLDEYQLFLEAIPQKTRERVAQTVRDAPLETLADLTYMCSNIVAELLAGNIPPSVASAAQPYAELMYTALISKGKADKPTHDAAFSTVLSRLQTAANNAKTLEAKYVVEGGSFVDTPSDKTLDTDFIPAEVKTGIHG